jgi:hypothetical protein
MIVLFVQLPVILGVVLILGCTGAVLWDYLCDFGRCIVALLTWRRNR